MPPPKSFPSFPLIQACLGSYGLNAALEQLQNIHTPHLPEMIECGLMAFSFKTGSQLCNDETRGVVALIV
ncbi:MAG: hypothetical protein LBI79_04210 [Nitrososphaerota archaeon]|nr:hypothetical protein [Nitrososphaerota archaeon]